MLIWIFLEAQIQLLLRPDVHTIYLTLNTLPRYIAASVKYAEE